MDPLKKGFDYQFLQRKIFHPKTKVGLKPIFLLTARFDC